MKAEIFVFGSNLAGRHGKGAALVARNSYNAVYGQGVGIQGMSYAIPTKDEGLNVLSLDKIADYVDEFIKYAEERPWLIFNMTRIGCGLAGYTDEEIAPLFKGASPNINFPDGWEKIISNKETLEENEEAK